MSSSPKRSERKSTIVGLAMASIALGESVHCTLALACPPLVSTVIDRPGRQAIEFSPDCFNFVRRESIGNDDEAVQFDGSNLLGSGECGPVRGVGDYASLQGDTSTLRKAQHVDVIDLVSLLHRTRSRRKGFCNHQSSSSLLQGRISYVVKAGV